MGAERTLPHERSHVVSPAGCSGSDMPEVRAKPQPAALSKETVRLLGQEPSVEAKICREGGQQTRKRYLFYQGDALLLPNTRKRAGSNLVWR